MLPTDNDGLNQFALVGYPSNTYKLDTKKERVRGFVDGLEAVRQAVYKIINTERYDYVMYSWDYGIELHDLFGRAKNYVISELPRRITEALTHDDRITTVNNFVFDDSLRDIVSVQFTVHSTEGIFDETLEVRI